MQILGSVVRGMCVKMGDFRYSKKIGFNFFSLLTNFNSEKKYMIWSFGLKQRKPCVLLSSQGVAGYRARLVEAAGARYPPE